jgi:MFS transporter, DHA1 family, multidrug resistance protein
MKLRLNDTSRLLLEIYGPAMIMSLGHGMVIPTIPTLAASFGVSAGLAAQLVTAAMVGRVVTGLPMGQVLDRYGRKPVLVGGPLIVAAASGLSAVAPDFWLLLFGQFLTGVGSSAWQTARELAAIDVVRPELRGRMMSGFHGMHSVGTAVGPVMGGVLTDLVSFRAVFWAYALLGLLTLAIAVRVKETAPSQPTARPGLLEIGRVSEVEPRFRTTYVVLIFNTFVAMMRGALIASLIPLYIGLQLGHTSTEVGTWFGLYGLVNILMIAPTSLLLDTRGRKAMVMPSAYLATVVFVFFPLASGNLQLLGLAALTGLAGGLSLGTMATYAYDVIPVHARARLQALRRLFADLGAIMGPVVGGAITDLASPSAAFWAFVPLQLAGGLAITFLARESLQRVGAPPRDADLVASRAADDR